MQLRPRRTQGTVLGLKLWCVFNPCRRLGIKHGGGLSQTGITRCIAGAIHLVDAWLARCFGCKSAQGCVGYGRRCAMPRIGQCMAQTGNDEAADHGRLAKPHL